MPRVARNFRFFADRLLELEGSADADYDGNAERVTWDPAGVTAVVSPWNAPLMLATWRIAPALAAGQHRGPEAARMGAAHGVPARRHRARCRPAGRRVQRRAGDRRGGRVPRSWPTRTSIASRSPARSTPGRLVAPAAARNLTPVSLELGGKSPFLIFADADPDAALRQAIGQFDNAGQVCLAGTRLLIEAPIYDEFLERFADGGRGDPPGRSAARRHRHRSADHAGALRARRRVRAAGAGRRRDRGGRRRPERGARRPVLPADPLRRTRRRAARS